MLRQRQRTKLAAVLRSWLPLLEASADELDEELAKFAEANPVLRIQSAREGRLPSLRRRSNAAAIEALNIAATDRYEQLELQLCARLFPTERSQKIARFIIENLNAEGYYEEPEELAAQGWAVISGGGECAGGAGGGDGGFGGGFAGGASSPDASVFEGRAEELATGAATAGAVDAAGRRTASGCAAGAAVNGASGADESAIYNRNARARDGAAELMDGKNLQDFAASSVKLSASAVKSPASAKSTSTQVSPDAPENSQRPEKITGLAKSADKTTTAHTATAGRAPASSAPAHSAPAANKSTPPSTTTTTTAHTTTTDTASREEIERVRARFAYLEPAGIAASSYPEAVRFALAQSDLEGDAYELAAAIAAQPERTAEFVAAAAKDPAAAAALASARDFLSRLQLPPWLDFAADSAAITPDLIVDLSPEGSLRVSVADDAYSRVLIDEAADRKFYAEQLRQAAGLIDALELRRATLLKIGLLIIELQYDYFAGGAIVPMKLADIAGELGRNASTISRAIAGKYLASPRGLIALKEFFCAAVDDEGTSNAAVKALLRELVAGENPRKPLSDAALVAAINERLGVAIVRRTVTKYRAQLGIPGSSERRKINELKGL